MDRVYSEKILFKYKILLKFDWTDIQLKMKGHELENKNLLVATATEIFHTPAGKRVHSVEISSFSFSSFFSFCEQIKFLCVGFSLLSGLRGVVHIFVVGFF